MEKIVRIGGAGASSATARWRRRNCWPRGGWIIMVADYLAEVTMSLLARSQAKNPEGGYARDFTDWVWKDKWGDQGRRGEGGHQRRRAQSAGCRARMQALAAEAGLSFKIAVVEGDDSVRARPSSPANGRCSPARRAAAGGSGQHQRLFRGQADRRGAGGRRRCSDHRPGRGFRPGAGPLAHEFGWAWDDYDKIARDRSAATSWNAAPRPRGDCSPTGSRCPTGRISAIRSPSARPTARSWSPSRKRPAACARRPPSPSRSSTRSAIRKATLSRT